MISPDDPYWVIHKNGYWAVLTYDDPRKRRNKLDDKLMRDGFTVTECHSDAEYESLMSTLQALTGPDDNRWQD